MAGSIKGITVKIGGDTTALDKALKGINTEIRSTQSELKDVERLLKLDPTNTELLKQKQDLLAKSVKDTSDKLKTLKDAEKQAQAQFKEGKISEDQYRALEREIIKTEQSLKSLESQAAKSNATLNKIGNTVANVADKTKGVSTAAAGLLGAGVAGAVNIGKKADELNTLAKQTGLTTAELQKMQYASELVDVSVESITGSMRKMTKNMNSTSSEVNQAWQTLGVSLTNVDGSARDVSDAFYDTLEALSKVGNETERDQLAMSIFGKSANELAGIVDDGGAALKKLGQEAEDAGLIMSQEAVDGANEFNDIIDKTKAKASAAFGQIAGKLSTILFPVLESASNKISSVLDWVSQLSPTTQKVILIILAIVAAISPIAGLISGITTVMGALNAVMAANPVMLVVMAVAALIAIFVVLWNKCEGFRQFWINLCDGIKNAFLSVIDWFKGIFTETIPNIFNNLTNWLGDVFNTDWSTKFGALGEPLNAFFQNIKNIFVNIKNIFSNVIDFIKNVFTGNWSAAWENVINIFKGIFNNLVNIFKIPINGIIGLLNAAITAINKLIGGLNKIKFDIPDWVPYLGGKTFGINIKEIGKIPYLAKGGNVLKGTALVGEAGPELLTVMNGKTTVTPLNGNNSAAKSINNTYNSYGASQLVNVFAVGNKEVSRVIQPTVSVLESNKIYGRRRAGYAKM